MVKTRFRVLIPVLWLVVSGFLNATCFVHIGHWSGCNLAYYTLMPAVFLVPEHLPFGIVWAFLMAFAQYLLLGLAVDKVFLWKHGRSTNTGNEVDR
jgi:hypothetical protein